MAIKPSTSEKNIKGSASELVRLSAACLSLANLLPPRTTIRQVAAFALLVRTQSMGHSVTLTELAGSRHDGEPTLGASPERILQPFMEPTKRDPDSAGWVAQVEDEDDRRRKYLILTKEGLAVAFNLAKVLKEVFDAA